MARRAAIKQQDEDGLAKDVAQFLRIALPAEIIFWHTPNGGARVQVERTDRRTGRKYRYSPEAQKLKAMGVLAGVPDLTLILPNGQAAFIELKVGDNTLSDEQAELRERLIANHCGYETARSLEDVQRIVGIWLALYGLKLRGVTGPLFAGRAA